MFDGFIVHGLPLWIKFTIKGREEILRIVFGNVNGIRAALDWGAVDWGWRLDYFLVSEALVPRVKDAIVHEDVLESDHCPVELILGG
jgi:exonuclease III